MEHCTCGAHLFEGSRFCHKCGRPVGEEPVVIPLAVQEPPAPPAPALPAEAPPAGPGEINFRNSVAVRVAFLVAGIGILVNNVTSALAAGPAQFAALIALSMASGAFATWLYRRRTGQPVSVAGGARLGWITGVFSFVIVTVITTLTIAMVGADKVMDAMRDPAFTRNVPQADLQALLANPATVAFALIFALAFLFAVYTVAASVGGAVGAKMFGREPA